MKTGSHFILDKSIMTINLTKCYDCLLNPRDTNVNEEKDRKVALSSRCLATCVLVSFVMLKSHCLFNTLQFDHHPVKILYQSLVFVLFSCIIVYSKITIK